MDHAIVGFEFTGDPLLEGETLPLTGGLTVIYGLNGAGKPRLLDGLRLALLGIRSDIGVSLVVRVQVPTPEDIAMDHASISARCPGAGLLLTLGASFAGRGCCEQ